MATLSEKYAAETLVTRALNDSTLCREYRERLTKKLGDVPIIEPPGSGASHRACAPRWWAIVDLKTHDILGAGEALSEALEEAIATVNGWKP
ncbi:MAG: hypothetical protein WC565_05235 [Parcubacteria group bacterium]|jgi:hypothetical protein